MDLWWSLGAFVYVGSALGTCGRTPSRHYATGGTIGAGLPWLKGRRVCLWGEESELWPQKREPWRQEGERLDQERELLGARRETCEALMGVCYWEGGKGGCNSWFWSYFSKALGAPFHWALCTMSKTVGAIDVPNYLLNRSRNRHSAFCGAKATGRLCTWWQTDGG